MAVIETWLHQDADSLVEVVPLKGNLFYGDNEGNLVGVEVTRAGAAVSLPSGCYGFVLRSDGSTEYVPGTVSGNKAWIILPTGCYAQVGPIGIVIKTGATKQGNKAVGGVTLAACTGYVYKTHTDTIVDPGSVLPDIGQLQQAMANCIAATNETENIDISQTKSGNTITVRTTNRNGVSTENTLTEPTVTVTKHGTTDPVPAREGDFDITVKSSNGTQVVTNTVTIPNPNKELSDRAHVETVSRSKTRTGNPIVIEDAVAEIADKTVIKLEPKQDLHGYDKPWVGGAGKNIFNSKNLVKIYKNSSCEGATSSGENGVIITASASPITNAYIYLDICEITSQMVGKSYTVSYTAEEERVSSVRPKLCYCESDGSVRDSGNAAVTYTILQEHVGKRLTVRLYGTSTANAEFEYYTVQVEEGSSETAFEPYENICPITGYNTVNVTRTGKNLLELPNNSELNGLKFIREDDGTLSISGTSTGTVTQYLYRSETNGVLTGEYIITIEGTISMESGNGGIYASDADKTRYFTQIKTDKIQIANNGINNIWFYASSGATVSASHLKVSITKKTEDFVPGKFALYPIAVSLAEDANHNQAGTVYGGTVTVNADGSGTVVVDRKAYDMGSAVNYKHTTYTSCFGLNVNLYTEWTSGIVETISSMFPVDLSINFSYNSSDSYPDNTMFRNSGNKTVYLKCSAYANMTLEEVQTALTGQNIVVPITPITYELTANQVQTLLGYNYIYTDGADITLTYRQQTLASNDILLGLLPTGTATGNPAVISDGAESVPLKNLTVNIEPNQDTHGYGKAWIGGAGKNLATKGIERATTVTSQGVSVSVDASDHSVTIEGTNSSATTYAFVNYDYEFGVLKYSIGVDYYIDYYPHISGVSISMSYTENGATQNGGRTEVGGNITIPSTATASWIRFMVSPGTTVPRTTIYPFICLNSESDKSFEPYENICPISGRTAVDVERKGKNLFNADIGWQNNTKIRDDNGAETGSSGSGYTYPLYGFTPNTTYTISGTLFGSGQSFRLYYLDSSNGWISRTSATQTIPYTFTTPANCYNVQVQCPVASADFSTIQIEPGETATAYEPTRNYTISLPSEAGTVYGGTLTLDQNGEGTLTVDIVMLDITNMTIGSVDGAYKGRFRLRTGDNAGMPLGLARGEYITSSHMPGLTDPSLVDADRPFALIAQQTQIMLQLGVDMTFEEIQSYISAQSASGTPVTVSYKIATPTTYTLTAEQVKTLLGTNYISCDAGSMTIEYFKKLLDGTENSGTGEYSHVEGRDTVASGLASHAEGDATEATGTSAHSEGYSTHATGDNSHSEGMNSTASGEEAHAEGFLATASGAFSHAEGSTTTASGQSAHAEGKGTIANHLAQHVFGIFNAADPMESSASYKGLYVEIVGNGEDVSNRSNARTLDWNGNEILSGKLTVGASPTNSMDVATKEYVDNSGTLVVTIPVSSGSNIISAFGGTKYGEYKAIAFHGANPGIFSSMTVQTSTSYSTTMDDYRNGISVSCTFTSASTAVAVVTIVLQKVSKVRTYTRNGSTYSYTDTTPLTHTTVFDV